MITLTRKEKRYLLALLKEAYECAEAEECMFIKSLKHKLKGNTPTIDVELTKEEKEYLLEQIKLTNDSLNDITLNRTDFSDIEDYGLTKAGVMKEFKLIADLHIKLSF